MDTQTGIISFDSLVDEECMAKLKLVAAKLTRDRDFQKDLVQEMLVYLVRVLSERPGMTQSWYIKGCEFQARNYIKTGRSVDSLKRARDQVPCSLDSNGIENWNLYLTEGRQQEECIARVTMEDLKPFLTDKEATALELLANEWRVGEIAEKFGVTHSAVVKWRRNIAEAATKLGLRSSFIHTAKYMTM